MKSTRLAAMFLLVPVVLVGCGGGAGDNSRVGRYTVADAGPVDTAGGGYQAVSAPNDAGQLVAPVLGLGCGDGGNVNGCYSESPYIFTPGLAPRVVQQQGTLQAINNHGDVIGFGPDGISFIIQGDQKTLVGDLGGAHSQAEGINDAGQVCGSSAVSSPSGPFHAFVWQAGRTTDLGGLPGFSDAEAFGINNKGGIVGDCSVAGVIRAAYWHDGRVDDLGALAPNSEALAINDAGTAAGWAGYSDGVHAVVWANGTLSNLGPGIALGIKDTGAVVGSAPSHTLGYRAILWSGAQAIDLNTQIAPTSGWVLQSASGINTKGQIAGAGLHNGVERAFLLTPR
jgi:probable HAF family extracellular repeat protein